MRQETENFLWDLFDSLVYNPIKKVIKAFDFEDWAICAIAISFYVCGGFVVVFVLGAFLGHLIFFCTIISLIIIRHYFFLPLKKKIKQSRSRYLKQDFNDMH